MKDKNTQIQMLSNAGFDNDKIKVALGVNDEEIKQALNAPQVEPVNTVERTKRKSGPKPQYTEELWKEGKAMRERGAEIYEIAKKQGFSVNFTSSVLRCNSYDEVVELRKAAREKKRKYNSSHLTSRQYNNKKNWVNAAKDPDSEPTEPTESAAPTKKEKVAPELIELRTMNDMLTIELRTMNDTLLRIAEALEKKRGLFRK